MQQYLPVGTSVFDYVIGERNRPTHSLCVDRTWKTQLVQKIKHWHKKTVFSIFSPLDILVIHISSPTYPNGILKYLVLFLLGREIDRRVISKSWPPRALLCWSHWKHTQLFFRVTWHRSPEDFVNTRFYGSGRITFSGRSDWSNKITR